MKRTAPPSTEQEQKTYRFYFVSSVVVGITVMAASIGWRIYAQARGNHVYQIAIVDLEPNETVLSDFFRKNNPRPTMADAPAMHDAYFLIVQDRPFAVGDTIRFQYFKISTDPAAIGRGISGQRIEVKYTGGRKLNYRVKSDGSGPKLEVAEHSDRGEIFTAEDVGAARSVLFSITGAIFLIDIAVATGASAQLVCSTNFGTCDPRVRRWRDGDAVAEFCCTPAGRIGPFNNTAFGPGPGLPGDGSCRSVDG